ncbi:MAG: DUF1566 domain-containing protein, partial [Deltaproteobacteria bacterium]|nr:DUF1566 domain-containing protein [Deltaproteobacteria bacterium]
PEGTPAFCGQDAQYPGNTRTFSETTVTAETYVSDSLTGLDWQQAYTASLDWYSAGNHCSTLSYAGFTDWRLPDFYELTGLIDWSTIEPAIDTAFAGTPNEYFWSATSGNDGTEAVRVRFDYGGAYLDPKTYSLNVRCVRGDSFFESMAARFLLDETTTDEVVVVDQATGLNWQQLHEPNQSWQEALEFCEGLGYGGHSAWRLPTVNELRSLLNHANATTLSDFPGMAPLDFWTSTTFVYSGSYADYVGFGNGYISNAPKANNSNVRCVHDAW